MTERVGVWIDYENARRAAADCSGAGAVAMRRDGFKSQPGHFWPLALARRLVARRVMVPPSGDDHARVPTRELVRVAVFLGQPNARYRPGLAHYVERQTEAWARQGVDVTLLPTRIGPSGEAEKGVDVSLALSIHDAAHVREIDVVILVSADNDLLPVVHRLHPRRSYLPAIELATWRGSEGRSATWAPAGVVIHRLDSDDYAAVASDLVRDFGRPDAEDDPDDILGEGHRDERDRYVPTLADCLAEAGFPLTVDALRPLAINHHGDDARLWAPQPATGVQHHVRVRGRDRGACDLSARRRHR